MLLVEEPFLRPSTASESQTETRGATVTNTHFSCFTAETFLIACVTDYPSEPGCVRIKTSHSTLAACWAHHQLSNNTMPRRNRKRTARHWLRIQQKRAAEEASVRAAQPVETTPSPPPPVVAAPLDIECLSCPVCLDIAINPIVLPECGHMMCEYCTVKLVWRAADFPCPCCRQRQHVASVPRPCVALRNMARSSFPSLYAEREAELRGLDVKVRTLRNKVDAVLASMRRAESEELVGAGRRGHGTREVVDAILEASLTERATSGEATAQIVPPRLSVWRRAARSLSNIDTWLLLQGALILLAALSVLGLAYAVITIGGVMLFSCIAVALCLPLAFGLGLVNRRTRCGVIAPVVAACIIVPAVACFAGTSSTNWMAETARYVVDECMRLITTGV